MKEDVVEDERVAKVLLVEDNDISADMLRRRLARRGFAVTVAADGIDALARVTQDRPDVILMDLSLPGLDGWTVTRRVKAQPETAAIPIIALTAHAFSADRDRALAAGCDDFEIKPIDLDRLLAKIHSCLHSSRVS